MKSISNMGFKGVEIFENDFLTNNLSPKEVKKIVQDSGLEITLFQPFRDFEGMPENHRIRAFDRAKRKFDIMQELETDLVLICSNTSNISLGGKCRKRFSRKISRSHNGNFNIFVYDECHCSVLKK